MEHIKKRSFPFLMLCLHLLYSSFGDVWANSTPPPSFSLANIITHHRTLRGRGVSKDEVPACIPEEGFWRPGATYNDPVELITTNATECCDICRSKERCVTWSRERASGACALKDRRVPLVENADFDSGFPAGNEASETATLNRCFKERGIAYPGGDVLRRTRTKNGRGCCELCREDVRCFSWYRNGRTGRCILNQNVPTSKAKKNYFTGSALI